MTTKFKNDVEAAIVSSFESQFDDCGRNENKEIIKLLEKQSPSTSKTHDDRQLPPPPPPRSQPPACPEKESASTSKSHDNRQLSPSQPLRSQPSARLTEIKDVLQQLKPVVPQPTKDSKSTSRQQCQESQSGLQPSVQDCQSENQYPHSTMQEANPHQFHQRQPHHQHLNFDDSDLQFDMSFGSNQQLPQSYQQRSTFDQSRMSYNSTGMYYYQPQNQPQNQPLHPIVKPERQYDVNFMNPLPSYNTFSMPVGNNVIKRILEDLWALPWADARLLSFLNVFHQFYNGSTIGPSGEYVIVAFKDSVPPFFKRRFINYTISVGMMRHMYKCPQDKIPNEGCQNLYDPHNLQGLKIHIQNEVRKYPYDTIHPSIRFDEEGNFRNAEADLKNVYLYTKRFFNDLESNVRNFLFQPLWTPVSQSNATYLAVEPSANTFSNCDPRYF